VNNSLIKHVINSNILRPNWRNNGYNIKPHSVFLIIFLKKFVSRFYITYT